MRRLTIGNKKIPSTRNWIDYGHIDCGLQALKDPFGN